MHRRSNLIGPIVDRTHTRVIAAATVDENRTPNDHWKAVARLKKSAIMTRAIKRDKLDSRRLAAALRRRPSVRNTELAHKVIWLMTQLAITRTTIISILDGPTMSEPIHETTPHRTMLTATIVMIVFPQWSLAMDRSMLT